VGASLLFSAIRPSDVGYSLIVLIIGVICRITGIFIATFRSKYNYRERLLMAVSWISKGTITATIGGIVLSQMKAKGEAYAEYQLYG